MSGHARKSHSADVIGLDSNVLLRAATSDDATQSPIARQLLQALTAQAPGYINVVVLSEFAWTLDRRHGYSRKQITDAIERMLSSTSFVVAERDAVSRALTRAVDDALDFPDALLCEPNLAAGCPATVTFDRKAARTAGFSLAR